MENKNKYIILIVVAIIIVAIIGAFAYINNTQLNDTGRSMSLDGKTEFRVYAFEPSSAESQIETMKEDYLDFGYNNETIKWLEGFSNYVLVDSDSANLLMTREEASKLPVVRDYGDYDTMYYNVIKCEVVETHSMGSGLKDIILVKDVEFVSNHTEKI